MKTEVINTEIKVFNHPVFGNIRVTLINGEPHFCLADICKSLEIKNASDLKSRLNPKGIGIADTPTKGGVQPMTYVNEGGMYKATFSSRKPEAEKFQDWLCYDVVPSIRKTGGYIASKQNDTPEMIMARALQVAQRTIDNHEQQVKSLESRNYLLEEQNNKNVEVIKQQAPKVKYYNDVLESKGGVNPQTIAKDYIKNGRALSAERLNKLLYSLGVQYKQGNQWLLYQKYANKGFAFSVPYYYTDTTGNPKTSYRTVWTEKGKQFIHELLIEQGYERANSQKAFNN